MGTTFNHATARRAVDTMATALGLRGSGLAEPPGGDPTAFGRSLRPAQAPRPHPRIPIIGYAQAGARGFFDDAGYPVGSGWDEVELPQVDDPHAYALEVNGDSMAPLFRDGDVIVVSPGATVRPGDRVVVKTHAGEIMAKELVRRSGRRVELKSLNPDHEDRILRADEIAWMARILWLSQ